MQSALQQPSTLLLCQPIGHPARCPCSLAGSQGGLTSAMSSRMAWGQGLGKRMGTLTGRPVMPRSSSPNVSTWCQPLHEGVGGWNVGVGVGGWGARTAAAGGGLQGGPSM